METSELLKKVRQIEIKTRGLSSNIFAGQYHSAFKGRGMAFSEVREYQYGDDVRDIDWNVTARFHKPFIKVFEEERELTVMLLVDVSGSLDFGTVKQLKREMVTEIAATLAFSAIQNNDKIGVIFFSDKIEKFIPPKKGRKHILYIIRELIDFQPESKKTDIKMAIEYLTHVLKKRCTAFIMSDFITQDDFRNALTIANRKHDIAAIQVYDRRIEELPNIGLMKVCDAETGHMQYIDTYKDLAIRHQKKYKIPASITLAQGLLESGAGRGTLARKSNNHFGIKCHNKWTGARVYHDDDAKGECFRKYKHPEDSYEDHSLFLTRNMRYAQLFEYNQIERSDCNRGVSGIDGATSTAVGAACVRRELTVFITGDMGFLYDSNALWNRYVPPTLKIIVMKNGGGGIFRFIQGPSELPELEEYFETAQEVDVEGFARLHGFDYYVADSEDELRKILSVFFRISDKPAILSVETPRTVNDRILRGYFKR